MGRPLKAGWRWETAHQVKLYYRRPIYSTPRKEETKERVFKTQGGECVIAQNQTVPDHMKWADPAVLALKKDGLSHFCVRCSKMDRVTLRDSYLSLLVDECMEFLDHTTVFSTRDSSRVLRKLRWRKQTDWYIVDSIVQQGLFRFTWKHFYFWNALGTFQKAMNISLSSVKRLQTFFCMDEVVNISRKPAKHINDIQSVLTLLKAPGVTLKPSKCKPFSGSINYLGHTIWPKLQEIAFRTSTAIRDMKRARTMKEPKYILGLCNAFQGTSPPLPMPRQNSSENYKTDQKDIDS